MRELIQSPGFLRAQALAGGADNLALRDALLAELAGVFQQDLLDRVGLVLNGYLGLDSHYAFRLNLKRKAQACNDNEEAGLPGKQGLGSRACEILSGQQRSILKSVAIVEVALSACWGIYKWNERASFPGRVAYPPLGPLATQSPSAKPASSHVPPEGVKAQAGTVLLMSKIPSWIEAHNAHGSTLYRGIINGQRSFDLGSGLRVLAARADLIRVRERSGLSYPLGVVSDVVWYSLPR